MKNPRYTLREMKFIIMESEYEFLCVTTKKGGPGINKNSRAPQSFCNLLSGNLEAAIPNICLP